MYPHLMSAAEVSRVADLTVEEREVWFAEVMLAHVRPLDGARRGAPRRHRRALLRDARQRRPARRRRGDRERPTRVEACDGRIVEFGGYTMVSLGYSNITPFDSPRELDEDELYRRVEAMADAGRRHRRAASSTCTCRRTTRSSTPRRSSTTSCASSPTAGQPRMIPVGSTAVRELIERYQPLLALHGHVHESRGATRIGRTLCINPGSDYHTGRISGVLVHLATTHADYQFVIG